MKPVQIANDGGAQFKAHNQWASRPSDERFLSLLEMQSHFRTIRDQSRSLVVSNRSVQLKPEYFRNEALGHAEAGLCLYGKAEVGYEPTHWAFGQLATLAGAPAGYLRTLPPEMASDCVNYGLKYARGVEEMGILLHRNSKDVLRACTGPNYGRIWNSDITDALISHVGDGVTGSWRVPGEFGQAVRVNRDNTTLYASDRDMFVFLADEQNRVQVEGREKGLAKGIYVWNSEVGSATFGLGLFYFDFACCNRIVWGMDSYKELKFRHTAGAPDRYFEEIEPALRSYAQASTKSVEDAIQAAQADKLADVAEFLANRFGPRVAKSVADIHLLEEGKPIETRWDVVTGATAYARSIPYQDTRVDFERQAGALLTR